MVSCLGLAAVCSTAALQKRGSSSRRQRWRPLAAGGKALLASPLPRRGPRCSGGEGGGGRLLTLIGQMLLLLLVLVDHAADRGRSGRPGSRKDRTLRPAA